MSRKANKNCLKRVIFCIIIIIIFIANRKQRGRVVHTCDANANANASDVYTSNANAIRMRYAGAFQYPKMAIIQDSGNEIKDGGRRRCFGIGIISPSRHSSVKTNWRQMFFVFVN